MRAGDVVYPVVRVLDSSGVAVTGKVTGDFTITGYVNATTPAVVFTATELGSGYYRLAVTSSTTVGWQQYRIAQSTNYVIPDTLAGSITAQDEDSLFAVVVRPVATLNASAVIATQLNLELIANRYAPITIGVTDQAGTAFDLSGYTTWRFTVWNTTHSGGTFLYQLTGSGWGSAGGALSFNIPETAAFYSQIDAAITAGLDLTTLKYDVVADQAGVAGQSRTIIRGDLILYRYETAA